MKIEGISQGYQPVGGQQKQRTGGSQDSVILQIKAEIKEVRQEIRQVRKDPDLPPKIKEAKIKQLQTRIDTLQDRLYWEQERIREEQDKKREEGKQAKENLQGKERTDKVEFSKGQTENMLSVAQDLESIQRIGNIANSAEKTERRAVILELEIQQDNAYAGGASEKKYEELHHFRREATDLEKTAAREMEEFRETEDSPAEEAEELRQEETPEEKLERERKEQTAQTVQENREKWDAWA